MVISNEHNMTSQSELWIKNISLQREIKGTRIHTNMDSRRADFH
jgi:hypothetical protein